jgi:hypothetical protein
VVKDGSVESWQTGSSPESDKGAIPDHPTMAFLPGGRNMGWLIACAALSLVIWASCIVLQIRNRLRMEDLQAVIRAQRKCMDNMEQELSCGHRKVGEPARELPGRARLVGQAAAARGASPFLSGRTGYGIEPSAN